MYVTAAIASPRKLHAPPCPRCEGPMRDNRATNARSSAPDFLCENSRCGKAFWFARAIGAFVGWGEVSRA